MKTRSAFFLGLALAVSFAAAAKKEKAPAPAKASEPALTQDQIARRALTGILRGMSADSLKPLFDDSVRMNVTEESMKGFADQISWLPRFIGDSLDPFMTGTHILDSTGRTAFFREYRFANESNKRAPLIVMHLMFKDSTSPLIEGAFNKNFDGDTKNRMADAQVWSTPSGDIDVHSISYVELSGGILPVIRVYDDADTSAIDSARAAAKGGPIVREAIKRGHLEAIKASKPGAEFINRFGVAFIRKEPAIGYVQISYALAPESYGGKSDVVKKAPAKASKTSTKKTPAKASPGKTAPKKK